MRDSQVNLSVPRAGRARMSGLRPIRKLVHGCHGSAAVEYAVLLAALLALMLAGAAMLGSSVDHAFTKILAGNAVSERHAPRGSSLLRTEDSPEAGGQSGAVTTRLWRVLVVCFLLAAATALVLVDRSVRRRATKKAEDREERPREPPTEEKILWTRLNMKRDLIWKHLLADQNLVLENRIEVRHVMTPDPIVVNKSTPGAWMAQLLFTHRMAYLAVCDSERRLLGVVKASDRRARPNACAADLMTPPAGCVAPNTALGAAISLLIEQGVSFLPVVDRGALCGVLTPTDLVLTLHCSLQLWLRVAQNLRDNEGRAQDLEATNHSIGEIADQLRNRVGRLPEQVKTAIQTGNVGALGVKLNETMAAMSRMMEQFEDARNQVEQLTSQVAGIKDPSTDEATGAASGEHLERDLGRRLAGAAAAKQPLSLIVCVADDYRRLRREDGQEAADEYLRAAVHAVANHIEPSDYVSRFREDTLAIVLPGTDSAAACTLSSRLSAEFSGLAEGAGLPPRMSIVAARAGESAAELLRRAEVSLTPCRPGPELAAATAS